MIEWPEFECPSDIFKSLNNSHLIKSSRKQIILKRCAYVVKDIQRLSRLNQHRLLRLRASQTRKSDTSDDASDDASDFLARGSNVNFLAEFLKK